MRHDFITHQQQRLQRTIRTWISLFIIALVLSGLTAMGVETQMNYLSFAFPERNTTVGTWLWQVYDAVKNTNQHYPFIAYGFDWLAFAHLVIATAFIGPLKDPVRNKWVIEFGRLACCMVIPFAFCAGYYRGIPMWWSFIDCAFGIVGLLPLTYCLRKINQLEQLQQIATSAFRSSEKINLYESAGTNI